MMQYSLTWHTVWVAPFHRSSLRRLSRVIPTAATGRSQLSESGPRAQSTASDEPLCQNVVSQYKPTQVKPVSVAAHTTTLRLRQPAEPQHSLYPDEPSHDAQSIVHGLGSHEPVGFTSVWDIPIWPQMDHDELFTHPWPWHAGPLQNAHIPIHHRWTGHTGVSPSIPLQCMFYEATSADDTTCKWCGTDVEFHYHGGITADL